MHGQVLDSVDSVRYLGVDIASDLNFTQNINRTTANASKSIGYLKQNILTKPSTIREAAYKTNVRPQVPVTHTHLRTLTESYGSNRSRPQKKRRRGLIS